MSDLSFLLYRSETTLAPRSEAANQLLAQARRNNLALGLTGFLHHEENFFFQWLEGPSEPLALMAARMEADPRHSHLTYLWRGTQEQRQFGEWKMGYSTSDDSSILAWLLAHPYAQRESQAYASTVLGFLQDRRARGA